MGLPRRRGEPALQPRAGRLGLDLEAALAEPALAPRRGYERRRSRWPTDRPVEQLVQTLPVVGHLEDAVELEEIQVRRVFEQLLDEEIDRVDLRLRK